MSFELAFEQVLGEVAKPTGQFYVVLWQDSPYYGGPEEGGWWGTDRIPLQYASFATEEAAEKAKNVPFKDRMNEKTFYKKILGAKLSTSNVKAASDALLDVGPIPEFEYLRTVLQGQIDIYPGG